MQICMHTRVPCVPLFGGCNPQEKKRLPFPLLSHRLSPDARPSFHPFLPLSLSPFFLRRDDGFLPAPLSRLNPNVECSFASGEWSSGRECVSLVTNTARRSFSGSTRDGWLHSSARLHSAAHALRSDTSSVHARISTVGQTSPG